MTNRRSGFEIARDAPIQKSVGLRSIQVGNETVILDVLSDKCYRLNSTGTAVWNLLDQSPNVVELSKQVAERYGLDGSASFQIMEEYIGELVRLGLASATVDQLQRFED